MPAQGLSNADADIRHAPKPKKSKDPAKKCGANNTGRPPGPITTEIYAEHAFFDSAKSIGIFTGRVIVKDPRFNVQADKLTVYMTKSEDDDRTKTTGQQQQQQTLEKAVAEGNVGVVRDAPAENGGPPQHSVGRADTATYTASDGNVEMRGSPRVQNGLNTHVATSPDTVMVMTQDGKLTTTGPSRTEIHQEPKGFAIAGRGAETMNGKIATESPPMPESLERVPTSGDEVLSTDELVKIYGGRAVVNGVNINVRAGEIVGLLGPNGAGKTTSFYMIVGLVRPNSGRVLFSGNDVTTMPMFKRARLGMGYLPQEESIFRKMTVEENIMAILETLSVVETTAARSLR